MGSRPADSAPRVGTVIYEAPDYEAPAVPLVVPLRPPRRRSLLLALLQAAGVVR